MGNQKLFFCKVFQNKSIVSSIIYIFIFKIPHKSILICCKLINEIVILQGGYAKTPAELLWLTQEHPGPPIFNTIEALGFAEIR